MHGWVDVLKSEDSKIAERLSAPGFSFPETHFL